MVTRPAQEVALLSIHPTYAKAIMSGEKRVEFRKQPFARPVEHVVVYATSPVQRVIGTFRVARCAVDEPSSLWDRYAHVGGISRDDFDAYYEGRSSGVAIEIDGAPKPLDLPLHALGPARAPQNFVYLDQDAAHAVGIGGDPCTDQTGRPPAAWLGWLKRRLGAAATALQEATR